MSNFQWTDMSSDKWFIIYPHSHEGPYSLNYLKQKLEEKTLDNQVKIWSEGLPHEMTLEAVMQIASPKKVVKDTHPSLPPLPIDDKKEAPPRKIVVRKVPLSPEEDFSLEDLVQEDFETEEVDQDPFEQEGPAPEELKNEIVSAVIKESEVGPIEETIIEPAPQKSRHLKAKLAASFLGIVLLLTVPLYFLQNSKKQMEFDRPQGMSLKVSERVENYLTFKGWDEPLFFKEFASEDYSNLWLASTSFHTCQIEAKFKSQKDKLLSLNDEDIEFEAVGLLKDHLVNFKRLNFLTGKKVIPGMYDMSVEASDCQWDGLVSSLMNGFVKPEALYKTKMTVILYNQGADEFKELLDKVLQKKLAKSIQEQNQIELFWQGIQEKLQTLLAVTLQVEQLFIDLTKKDFRQFHTNLPQMIGEYTKKYGSFLTSFVLANEESFKQIDLASIKGVSVRRNYEYEISELARQIGASSMKLIEGLQTLKNPRKPQLEGQETKVKQTFSALKQSINQKIIQVSDDRSPSQDAGSAQDSPSQK